MAGSGACLGGPPSVAVGVHLQNNGVVDELTAAFLCAELGIEGKLRHAEYINDWLRLLKADARAVVTAASKASLAADYLRSFSRPVEPTGDTEA